MRTASYLWPVALLAACGCGSTESGPPLAPVAGYVTLDGKPLGAADVMFIPQGETMGQAGITRTDSAGHFELLTPDRKRKGVAAGSYRVVINKLVNPDGTDFIPKADSGEMDAAFKEVLPAIYSDMENSQLSAEIPPEGNQSLEFKLKSKAR